MKKIIAVVSVVCLGACVCVGQTAQEVLEMVKKKYDSINDAQLKFSQKARFELARIEEHANGTLFVKKGNKYRVELEEQTIVTNGATVWSYSLPNNQVLIDNFKLQDNPFSPEKILTGAPKDFYATTLGRERVGKSEAIVLKLVPKDDQSVVKSMKLWVDDGDWLIKKVEISDVNGKQTEYLVNDIKVNIGLTDSRFTYQIPEGVEIVDLR
ncbi:MAG: outer membrane lipoprotein carrier protein LolA [Ignavibacteriae bacterium]|nr:outer membrane lipoprotein carrier protein LolA [Ignavibacteriota bacterium]